MLKWKQPEVATRMNAEEYARCYRQSKLGKERESPTIRSQATEHKLSNECGADSRKEWMLRGEEMDRKGDD